MTESLNSELFLRHVLPRAAALAAALTCLSLFSCAVRAQTAASTAAPAATPPKAPPAESTFTIGGGAAVTTRYAGSDETLVAPLAAAEYTHPSGFFIGTLRGAGYGGALGPVSYSAAISYRGPRYEKKKDGAGFGSGSKYLNGMGDVKGSVTGHVSVGYAVLPWLDLQVRTEQPLTKRENGAVYGLGLSAKLLDDGKDTWVLSAGANAGDAKYLQTYHGVTAAQAARTGYAVFTPKSGFYQVEASASWQHKFSKNWSVLGSVGAQHLVGDAAKSPLTRRKTTPVAYIAAGYTF